MSLITISTHVLDSSTGHPVPNMSIEIYAFSHPQNTFTLLRTIQTDNNGRNMDVLGNKADPEHGQDIHHDSTPQPSDSTATPIPTPTTTRMITTQSEHVLGDLTQDSKDAVESYQRMYKLRFHTTNYYKAQSVPTQCFYPYVDIVFQVDGASKQDTERRRHYHVPLILSPFGYTTYRGS